MKVGSTRFIHIPGVGIGMYMGMDSTLTTFPEMSSVSWETDPEIIAGKAVVPYGKDNNLPIEIRNIMEDRIGVLCLDHNRSKESVYQHYDKDPHSLFYAI